MKRKKVISLLLAGVMAISQPLSLQASDVSYESTTEAETLPAAESISQDTEMDVTASGAVEETEVQTTQEVLPETVENTEPNAEETNTAVKNSLSGCMILPNNTTGNVTVKKESDFYENYMLKIQDITAEDLKQDAQHIQESLQVKDMSVSPVLSINYDIYDVLNNTEESTAEYELYHIRIDMPDAEFLNGARLFHKTEGGTWEELPYKISNDKEQSAAYVEWDTVSKLGDFIFATTAVTTIIEDGKNNISQPENKETDNNEDLTVKQTEANKETESNNSEDLTIGGTQPGPETEKESEKIIEIETEYESDIETEPETKVPDMETEVETETEEKESANEKVSEKTSENISENISEISDAPESETETESETEMQTNQDEKTDAETEKTTTFTYEDEEVLITAEVKESAEIPDTAVLEAKKLEEGSDAYAAAMSEVANTIQLQDGQKLLFIPYDVYFQNAGEKIEPADGKVKIKMSFKEALFGVSPDQEETFAAHIKNDGVVEKVVNTSNETDTVSFDVTSFSIMGPAMIAAENDSTAVAPIIIDAANASLSSGATYTDGKYVWNPTDPVTNHMFTYRLDYTISGTFSTGRGAFKMEFPLHILKDRDGNWADTFECPYRMESELTETDMPDFVYSIDEAANKAYIYNYSPYPTGEAGYVEVGYSTSKTTMYYKDMELSDKFNAKISATNANSTVTKSVQADPVCIDTHATISYTQKKRPTLYKSWIDSWGKRPADADDYLYLIWPIRTYVNKNTSPYTFMLNDTFSDLGGSVVGYKFAGQTEFSAVDHVDDIMYYGDRYDYVLTRHSKAQANELVNKENRYELKNNITAIVKPKDKIDADTSAVSGLDWWYEAPVYKAPTGHFWTEKFGIYHKRSIVESSEDISNYELSEFYDGDINTIDDLKFKVYGNAYPYPWTLSDDADGTIDDVLKGRYGQKNVWYEMTDNTFYLEDTLLDANDYDISNIELFVTMEDAVFDQNTNQFYAAGIKNYKDSDKIKVYVLSGSDSTSRALAAEYSMATETFVNVNNAYVSSTGQKQLFFNKGVKGVVLSANNAYYHTIIDLYPGISLNRTDKVLGLIGKDKTKVRVKNSASFKVTKNEPLSTADEQVIFSRTVDATDYVQRVTRESELKKDVIKTKNMKRKQQYEATWRINFKEKYVDNDGIKYISQEEGKFYDLLPAGSVLDKDSISVVANGLTIGIGEYEYEVIDNFKDSGRSMLVVSIHRETKNYYELTYTTIHTYSAINDYGKNLLNSVAYESGNDKIGEGMPDNGGSITDKALFTNLDADTDAAKFKYEEARHFISVPVAASTGLKKQVKNSTESTYSYETTVHLNENYSYQIRLTNDANTESKDIIFYDSIENFYQKPEETKPTQESDWHGTLTGINLNNLRYKNILPVVYLSDVKSLNLQNHHDVSDTTIWMPYDEFVKAKGLGRTTAIAIDASKSIDGKDFVMAKKESISVDLYMQAPESDRSGKQDPIAYNNIYVNRTALRVDENEVFEIPQFYHQDYTKVHYRIAADVNLEKVDETDGKTPIPDITYQLNGISDYGTEYLETRVSSSSGKMMFGMIEKGTYQIKEIKCSDDWQLNNDVYILTVTEDGEAVINGLQKHGDAYIVTDKPRIHADLVFLKYNKVTGGRVKGAEFRLSGTSDYGNDYMMYYTSSEIGWVEFKNLELGTYELVETKVPEGYINIPATYTVKVDERGVAVLYYNFMHEEGEMGKDNDGYYAVYNEPYHSVRFVKSSTYGDNIFLEGAEFSLTGVSDYGTNVNRTATSGKAEDYGLVVFDNLEPGKYSLRETKAPAGHDLDEKTYNVTVRYDGTFGISGLNTISFETGAAAVSEEENGQAEVANEKLKFADISQDEKLSFDNLKNDTELTDIAKQQ